MILIEIVLLILVFKTALFVLKANKKKQLQEQKAQELASQQQARLAARLAREAERFEERQAREAERKAAFERKAQEQKAREEAKVREQKAREQELIRKFLSSDRSKKLGLTEDDVVITYVTETVTKNGNTKTFTYPKVVRI